jgi:hypothetical protein
MSLKLLRPLIAEPDLLRRRPSAHVLAAQRVEASRSDAAAQMRQLGHKAVGPANQVRLQRRTVSPELPSTLVKAFGFMADHLR